MSAPKIHRRGYEVNELRSQIQYLYDRLNSESIIEKYNIELLNDVLDTLSEDIQNTLKEQIDGLPEYEFNRSLETLADDFEEWHKDENKFLWMVGILLPEIYIVAYKMTRIKKESYRVIGKSILKTDLISKNYRNSYRHCKMVSSH